MKYQQILMGARVLIAAGLLMSVLPTLFAEYLTLPDFLRGALIGLGSGLELGGFVLLRRLRRMGSSC